MEKENYNGWSNRETWAYSLWLGNDEGLYNQCMEYVDKAKNHDDKDTQIWDLAKKLEGLLEELNEFNKESGGNKALVSMLEDIGSQWRIDFKEIAKSMLED